MKHTIAAVMGASLLALAACSQPPATPDAIEANPSNRTEQALAESLAEAIRFETIAELGNPDASRAEFDAFRDWLAVSFPLVHAQMNPQDILHGSLWYTLEGTNPALDPVVILAHQDVVPVEPGTEGQWDHPPFAGTIADGYVWGRGALDMKGFLVMALTAMETLLEEGFTPERTIHIGLGHDEEVAGTGAAAMAARLEQEGRRAWFVLDEGGTSIDTFPMTGGPVGLIGVGEKGSLTVEIIARARGGHSSTPPAETAIGLMSRAVNAIVDTPFEHAIEHPIPDMMRALAPEMEGMTGFVMARPGPFAPVLRGQLMADDATRATIGTTIAPTIVSGGTVANVLPQEARAIINLRLHPRDTTDSALAHMREAVSHLDGVTIEPVSGFNAPQISPTSGRAWEIIAGAAVTSLPDGAPVVPNLLTAATDSRAFRDVADNIYRYAPMRMEMDDLARIHGDNERIRTDALPGMVSFFRTVIHEAGMEG
ncbi:MAG: M20/M25/M40 family metallo-hydrolase [Caulobacterales bacterium]|uniref:M20/M25/M40 family metallo-hydrolase n=1 Tax=Glycocaulis sp. TaxID=1969725 RepID=UPI003F9EBB28